jgi:hypothetical protein
MGVGIDSGLEVADWSFMYKCQVHVVAPFDGNA